MSFLIAVLKQLFSLWLAHKDNQATQAGRNAQRAADLEKTNAELQAELKADADAPTQTEALQRLEDGNA